MTSLGSSEVAANAVRSSSKALRASFALRSWVIRTSRMTATPPKYQLWHPTRGISFSPAARSPNLAPQDGRALNEAAVTVNKAHTVASHADDLDTASLDPKLEGLSLSTSKDAPPNSSDSSSEAAKTVDENAAKQETPLETKVSDKPPVSALPFKMVDDLFYAAKHVSAGSAGSFWSYTKYRETAQDGTEQKVKVHYCRSQHTMEKVCQQYFVGEPVLGFDLEWVADSMKRHGVKKNVSLIQLASPSRIGLFHVALFTDKDDMVGPSFKAIMEDSNVTKVGVAIKGDATRLRNYLGIDSKGLLELSHLYKLVTHSPRGQYREINKRLVPLATQVEQYLHLPLFKGQDVRSSDWTKPLNMDQVTYSASDAYAGLQLYATLEYHRRQLDPSPPTPHHAELNLPIRLAHDLELASNDDPVVDAVEVTELEATAAVKSRSTTSKSSQGPKDSRVEIAEDRVACYRAAHPTTRVSVPQLRAYYMWHDQGLKPETIARLLRDPPLKTNTVIGYILAAIQLEKLPVDSERLRQEIASTMPDSTLRSRWPFVAAAISVSS
ncbi:ribonuclease H-like protein [Hypoxylon crocopeplum]|nr:ribonuclease H-like protein [Hypoxylon crocopeplum]